MTLRALVALLGLFHLANAAAMLIDPADWYRAVPGVAGTGPFNPHFVVDVGLACASSGALMLTAAGASARAAPLALAGGVWPALHAAFHIVEWLADGFPREAGVAVTEAVGVVLVGALGLALAAVSGRKHGVL